MNADRSRHLERHYDREPTAGIDRRRRGLLNCLSK
jgi:hypothetical protein